ncbi:condensation domain-containing protein, partial [Pseudomonas sp. NBRC 111119]|uniref:condensation domain-containing protein n=1 Tax=Pseudomonas sp. NBRC 111119 TaxID=1661034 RepID=UPI000ABB7689
MQELIESVGALSPKERKALAILLKQKGINLFSIAPIFRRGAEEPLLPSYAQQRQWFLWQLEPHSAAYNLSKALRLKGHLDVQALSRTLDALQARHESLRTTFVDDGEQLLQRIAEHTRLQLPVHDHAQAWAREGEDGLQGLVEAEIGQAFDLGQGPLWRVALLRLSADDHVLVLTLHHSICDGASMQVMVDELVSLYAGFSQGLPAQLAPMPIQYSDYASWQRQWMEAGEQARQLEYWKASLAGDLPVLELPTDRARPAVQSFAGACHQVELSAERLAGIKRLCQTENVTVFMLLLASFQVLLHRYSGQTDICTGVPIANRGKAGTEGLIGFLVNTQVLRTHVEAEQPVHGLLQQVREAALGAQAHQDLPFEQLVEALQPERSLSHNPLFQVMFNHQAQERHGADLELPGLRVSGLQWDSHSAQFDLTLNTAEHEGGVSAAFTYATDLFDIATVQRMADHWLRLLDAMVSAPHTRVRDLPMLS